MLSVSNTEIARDNPATMFVIAFTGILDVESGHLDFCCAGHEPPWYIKADGGLTRLEGVGGPPLCLLDEFDCPTDSVQLAPGDKLIVVTDGITEAVN
jgi:adenylate cyclase